MILGIGTDIVQIKRIETIYKKYGDVFKNRILGQKEIKKFDSISKFKQINFLAKRFAAKEAVSKAFGIGISARLVFKDIIILNDEFGKPYVEIDNDKISTIKGGQNIQINLSVADDYPTAIAFSIISIN